MVSLIHQFQHQAITSYHGVISVSDHRQHGHDNRDHDQLHTHYVLLSSNSQSSSLLHLDHVHVPLLRGMWCNPFGRAIGSQSPNGIKSLGVQRAKNLCRAVASSRTAGWQKSSRNEENLLGHVTCFIYGCSIFFRFVLLSVSSSVSSYVSASISSMAGLEACTYCVLPIPGRLIICTVTGNARVPHNEVEGV